MFFAPGGYSSAFFNSLEKNKKAPVVLGAGCLKLRPLEKDRFKTVNALDRVSEKAVSFEFVRKPGWFIRSLSTDLVIERRSKDADYEKDCSFFQLLDLWFPNFVAFESVEKAGYYLRMKNGRLVLQHYDGTKEFKEEASFKMESKISFLCSSSNDLNEIAMEKLKITDGDSRYGSECLCSVVSSFQLHDDANHNCENYSRGNETLNAKKPNFIKR